MMFWLHHRRPRSLCSPRGSLLLDGVPYRLPENESEISPPDALHFALRWLLRGNYLAPVTVRLTLPGAALLDVGCGSGRWAREMGQAFPLARVVGLDRVEPQPGPEAWPENVSFVRGNVLDGLPFPARSFDCVHQRLLAAALPAADWPAVIAELVRVTRPGGWVECVELGEFWLRCGPASLQMLAWSHAAARARGLETSLAANLGLLLARAGLLNMRAHTLEGPLGAWGGRVGSLLVRTLLEHLAALEELCCGALHLCSGERFREVLELLPREWESRRSLCRFYVVCGQRPRTL